MKQASNAIVLVILIVVIAVVAAPLLPGDGSPAASAEGTTGAIRHVSSTRQVATQPRSGAGEWAMLLVGSALVVVGAALRRPDSVRISATSGDRARTGRNPRLARRVTGGLAGGHPRHMSANPAGDGVRRVPAPRSLHGRER